MGFLIINYRLRNDTNINSLTKTNSKSLALNNGAFVRSKTRHRGRQEVHGIGRCMEPVVARYSIRYDFHRLSYESK